MRSYKGFFVLAIGMFFMQSIWAQCTDGTQPECTCGTAPVLCTVDQLDNYQFQMSTFQHPNDGPTPICPGVNNSQSNNPTWFAFTAWCTDLTLNVSFANCVPGTNGTSMGVQIAIYNDCSFTSPVDCNVSPADCNTLDKMLNLTGLAIGGVYYFLVDGCLGAACDVTIDVIGVCGAEAIDPWTLPVTGNLFPCAGIQETYSVESLPGAQTYHWFIDNALIAQTSTTSFNYTWPAAGTYQLCIDASNDPCVPVTDPPSPLCVTVNVGEAEAGTLTVNPSTLCPNEFSFITVSGYNASPDNTQAILIADATGSIVQVTVGDGATFTSADCASFSVYSFNFLTAAGLLPSIGDNVNSIDCAINCCDLEMMPLTFEDNDAPTFPNAPADIVLTCSDLIPPLADLEWNDNCDGVGMVMGTEQSNVTLCTGGIVTRLWEYMDACGNTGSVSQTITVDPVPAAAFVNPPASMTVDCDMIPVSTPDLSYVNGGTGACDISGTVPAVQTGSADYCGGTITNTWTFVDGCGNNVTHVQTIMVNPAATPTFQNPPADLTVTCDNIPTSAPDLNYTNNATGSCLIAGVIQPVQSGSADICGGTITYTWEFVDPCGNTVTHVQNITVDPAAAPVFQNPPADVTVTCDNVPASAPDLSYTNNETGTCLVSGTATAVQEGNGDICGGTFNYKWDFVDACGNAIEHTQTVTINPPAPAVFQNPPADITVNCDNIPTSAPDLNYTNSETGACLVMGSVPAVQSGNADLCGGTITYTWSFVDPCGNAISHVQNISVLPGLAPAFVNPPADMTVSCDNIPATAPALSYTNNDAGSCLLSGTVPAVQTGSADECGGTITFTWNYTDPCGNALTHEQNITVDPAPMAGFTSTLPADITVNCDAVPASASPLNYSNNLTGVCEIAGSQPAVLNGTYDACGGSLQFVWEFTDDCGRTIQHQQNITVNPAAAPTFTSPPSDITLSCSAVPASPPSLGYTNGASGLCVTAGSVPAIQSGFFDACGGNISYTWTFTDNCNNTITHVQNITVTPASDPTFVTLPPDVTINCGVPFPSNVPLDYTNGESGNCSVAGTVIATEQPFGLTTVYTWIFTNACNGATITHIQNVTQTAEPDIVLSPDQVTICAGQSFDLSTVTVTDLNGTNPNITFHSATPANITNQLPNGMVSPATTTTYHILAANNAGCSDEAPFTVVIEDPPFAGIDGFGTVCYFESFSVDLFGFLNGSPDQSGTWSNTYAVDVSNPYAVDLSGLAPGNYNFTYALPSGGVCPDDIAMINIEVLPEIFFEANMVACSADPNFYEVTINSFGFEITNLSGTYNDMGGGIILITDIPIGTVLVISATNPGNPQCAQFVSITSPDCDCPTIDPPVSNGDMSICEEETNPELSVTVNAGETANWYSDPAGTTLLLAESLTYTSSESTAGTYTYYVQAEEIASGCVSLILTPVVFEIIENPVAVNAQLPMCDEDGDGYSVFNLTMAETLISTDLSLTYTFHENMPDAIAGINPLPANYTNTTSPSQTIFAVVTNANNCTSIVEVELLVLPAPMLDLQITTETCLGDADGAVTINSATGLIHSIDSVNWGNSNIFNGLAAGDYTAYVGDVNGCWFTENFVIEAGLELVIDDFNIVCNDNGTASDATDDFYDLTFLLNNNDSGVGTYTVNDGTSDLGSFNYGASNSLTIPAMGQSLVLTFTDDVLSCSITQAIGPLSSCSTNCTISIDQLDIVCDDNGTDSEPSDDFYTVSINASAINGAVNNTYNVLIGGIVSHNFPYGIVSNFILPADGASVIITVVDNQDNQCQASQTIGPLIACSDACVIQFQSVDIICDDNGTLTNPADDFYTVSIAASAINPGAALSFEVFANSVSQGVFTYAAGASFTVPADGSTVLLEIQDADDAQCLASQSIGPLDPCAEDCTINATVSNIICNDNGTGNDSIDDTFTFDLLVNGQNTGSGWTSTDGTLTGGYGIVATFGPYLISGGNLSFDLEDDATVGCIASIVVAAPAPCSDACTISFDQLDIVCDDNGTLTNPGDDFYTINIMAAAINPGASLSFEIFANSVSQGSFTYAAGASFTLPADGSTVLLEIQDADDAQCLASQSIGPLDPCAEDCTINATVSNVVCDDNGTGNIFTDDTFTFDVLVNGQNTGSGWTSTDGTLSGGYGAVINFGPYMITGGDLNFELEDDATLGCTTPINVQAPSICSFDCSITLGVMFLTCEDNGTPTNPADDFYTIVTSVSGTFAGASNSYEVFANSVSQGIFAYEAAINFSLPADGSTIVLEFQDVDIPDCVASQTIGPLDPCAEDCTINATVSNVVCDDNGTGNDSTDDTFTFDVLVNGQNTGTGWTSTEGTLSGSYGTVASFGPYLITEGDLSFDLEDDATVGCIAEINVTAPAPCSNACVISFDQVDIDCDDNGTLTNPADDFYTINIIASAVNPGASLSFEVFANSVSQGSFTYAAGASFTLPADGSTVLLEIQDADDAQCLASQSIGPLDPCAEDCTINATVSNVICDDNGTGNDSTDDTFTFEVLVNGQNTGTAWVSTDGSLTGTYGTVATFGPYLITDGNLTFDLEDDATTGCMAFIGVTAPAPCSDPCVISFDQVDIDCDDNGTLTNPADDFYTINIIASAVNPGASLSFEVFANSVSQGSFAYGAGATFTLPADGSTVLLEIQDSDEASCTASQSIGPLDPCAEDCTINATVSNVLCNDNGTGNDSTDDTFTFDVLVNGQNTGTNWTSTDGSLTGTYGTVATFGSYLITGGNLNFELEDDVTPGCVAIIDIAAPTECSDPCTIEFTSLLFDCNDNGTLTNPNDDFYEISIEAVAVNAGIANSFEVFANTVSQGIYTYASTASFILPADGSIFQIDIQDVDEPLCITTQSIGPLEPCAEDCTISATVSNVVCDDNGTGNDSTDDTFTFDLLVNGQNTSTNWQSASGLINGNYGVVNTFGPFSIAGSPANLDFTIQDLTAFDCETMFSVSVPTACSFCIQTVDAGSGGTLTCEITSIPLLATSSESGTYAWSGPNSFSANALMTTVTNSGWYYFTATYADNCEATDSVFVDIENDIPIADAGPDLFINCYDMQVVLDGTNSIGAALQYEWTFGGVVISNDPTFIVDQEGTYTLQITDGVSGCISTDDVQVIDDTGLPSAVIYADPVDILDCVVSSIILTSDNEPDVIYNWNSDVTGPQYVVSEGGMVNLIAIDTISGCENTNEINITDLEDYPLVELAPTIPVSCYNPTITIDGSGSQVNSNIVYSWYYVDLNNEIPGATSNMLEVDLGGIYYLQLTDTVNGCLNYDSIFVETLLDVPLAQDVEDVSLFCAETTTDIAVNLQGATGIGITWTTNNGEIISGGTTATPMVNGSGTYTVALQDLNSGCISMDSLEVIVDEEVPEFAMTTVQDENCVDENDGLISVSSIDGGTPPYNYNLNGSVQNTTGEFPDLTPGIYALAIEDANGCSMDTSFLVEAGIALNLQLPEVIELIEDQYGNIQAVVNVPEEDLNYIQWNPPGLLSCDSCLTTSILAIEDQLLQLFIQHINGCLAMAELKIIVRPRPGIYIPNVFSPNDDGANEFFTLFANEEVEEIEELRIFDRWGEYVYSRQNFEPNVPSLGWDGTLKGKDMNPAVFVYYFRVRLKNGDVEIFAGDVTLMR